MPKKSKPEGKTPKQIRHSNRQPAIWVAVIGLLGTIGAAVITRVQGVWPFPSRPTPRYEAWMEVTPNPLVREGPASIQFFFNNSSDSRVTLTRMIAWDPCDAAQPKTAVEPGFPGWKSSVVEPQTHKHNFYSAEHVNFPYSCGAPPGEAATLSYKFDLLFEDGVHSAPQVVTFQKTVLA